MKNKTFLVSSIVGLTLASIPLTAQNLNAQTASAVVDRIVDGDTIVLRQNGTQITGQLACIDSPDWVNGQPQTHAQQSKDYLSELIPTGSSVRYDSLGTISGRRSLVVIYRNNRNINVQMVAAGLARLHSRYRQTCGNIADRLAAAQKQAQDRRSGVWIH